MVLSLCCFDQSIKEYMAYNSFFLGMSYLSSVFFLHPQNTWRWERVGMRPLRLGQLKKQCFLCPLLSNAINPSLKFHMKRLG